MRLSKDFINTSAAGTAQGLNLKHVLLRPRSPCAPCTSGYRPPLPDLSSLHGLSKGEGSLKADSVLQGHVHSSVFPREDLSVRSVVERNVP